MDKTLVSELKRAIDAIPFGEKNEEFDFSNSKSFEPIVEAIEAAGYKLEAHQRGIFGTYLCLVPKE